MTKREMSDDFIIDGKLARKKKMKHDGRPNGAQATQKMKLILLMVCVVHLATSVQNSDLRQLYYTQKEYAIRHAIQTSFDEIYGAVMDAAGKGKNETEVTIMCHPCEEMRQFPLTTPVEVVKYECDRHFECGPNMGGLHADYKVEHEVLKARVLARVKEIFTECQFESVYRKCCEWYTMSWSK